MKRLVLIFGAMLLFSFISTAQNKKENAAPQLNLEISVNGKSFLVKEGDTLQIEDSQIIVKTSQYKTFDYGIVQFDYPNKMAFSYEHDYEFRTWSLDGNDFVFLYYEFGVPIDLDDLVEEMVKKFGRKNCQIIDKEIVLGNVELSGKRIDVDLLGQKFTYDLYRIEKNHSKTYVVSFQDVKNPDGSDSKDFNDAMNVIGQTFTVL